jgi:hypothetical protein
MTKRAINRSDFNILSGHMYPRLLSTIEIRRAIWGSASATIIDRRYASRSLGVCIRDVFRWSIFVAQFGGLHPRLISTLTIV